jgi:hypothetical protein
MYTEDQYGWDGLRQPLMGPASRKPKSAKSCCDRTQETLTRTKDLTKNKGSTTPGRERGLEFEAPDRLVAAEIVLQDVNMYAAARAQALHGRLLGSRDFIKQSPCNTPLLVKNLVSHQSQINGQNIF